MKSRKGEYYIACYNRGDIYLCKKTGYILDDGENQYGMCRGEDGLYRITDLETGCLLNIYNQRKCYRLPEWHTFCEWIEQLPYFKEICLTEKE